LTGMKPPEPLQTEIKSPFNSRKGCPSMCSLKAPLLPNQACGHFSWEHLNQLLKPGSPFFLSQLKERVLCFGMGPCSLDPGPLKPSLALFSGHKGKVGQKWSGYGRKCEKTSSSIVESGRSKLSSLAPHENKARWKKCLLETGFDCRSSFKGVAERREKR
jgi:hypothetical protein